MSAREIALRNELLLLDHKNVWSNEDKARRREIIDELYPDTGLSVRELREFIASNRREYAYRVKCLRSIGKRSLHARRLCRGKLSTWTKMDADGSRRSLREAIDSCLRIRAHIADLESQLAAKTLPAQAAAE